MKKYNILEVPRALMDLRGTDFFKEGLVKGDSEVLGNFEALLEDGFAVKSLSTDGLKYVFLFEK